ncbi:c-type cytochrome [Veronia pacifica]|uniref:Cytochrome C n=1 Tax=Veronia pacifica TaxID=1080227 RepID=A0A1C3EJN6_9GAMM|nr:c-type cytochrome [Veronia pacifica]ODA33439.1 cytochrome C [Veronia pacifica]
MKKLALILTLFASFSAFAGGDVKAGQAISATCAACHGVDGNSAVAINPKLAGQHPKYLLKQLKEFKSGMTSQGKTGRYNAVMGGMVAALSEKDMEDLAAYFGSQDAIPGTTPESSIAVGQRLYRAGDPSRGIAACIACHGPRGNGTPLSGFPKISGQHADYTKLQLEMFRSGKRNNDMNGMMRSIAMKMTDDEILAISQYLGGLH